MAARKYTLREIQRVCAECGSAYVALVKTGNPRTHLCSDACKAKRRILAKELRALGKPACCVEGCSRPATRVASGLCETHFYRRRRTGTTAPRVRPSPAPRAQSHGYILERVAHPLSIKGSVYQHRRIAYDAREGQCPDCSWCAKPVTWQSCHVDHLNGVKSDNRPENLTVSCAQCNRARGAFWPTLLAMTDEGFEAFMSLAMQARAKV